MHDFKGHVKKILNKNTEGDFNNEWPKNQAKNYDEDSRAEHFNPRVTHKSIYKGLRSSFNGF